MNVNMFLEENRKSSGEGIYFRMSLAPMLVCMDGFKMSVQASRSHYCLPRNNTGPYTHVEVGYPTGPVRSQAMKEYCNSDSEVFPYVPVEVVEGEVALHGGWDWKSVS